MERKYYLFPTCQQPRCVSLDLVPATRFRGIRVSASRLEYRSRCIAQVIYIDVSTNK